MPARATEPTRRCPAGACVTLPEVATRVAFFSDVHADAEALRAALRRIDAAGIDRIVCAGELVDYGPAPDATIGLLAERAIPTVRGNHDRWALGRSPFITGVMDLEPPARRYLRATLPCWRARIEGVRIAVWHGAPDDDMQRLDHRTPTRDLLAALDAARADVLVVGHTHEPMDARVGRRRVLNPGALLRASAHAHGGEGAARGTFGVLELPSRRFRVIVAATGRAIRVPTSRRAA